MNAPVLGTKTRLHRSSAVRQTDLWLVAWALFSGGALWAGLLAEGLPEALGWLRLHLPALAAGAVVGFGLLFAVRLFFLRDDFRLVTDGESYFFLSGRDRSLLCRRREVLGYREEETGLRLETPSGPLLIEAPVQALVLVENLLARWSHQDGRPQDPPHTPPYAR